MFVHSAQVLLRLPGRSLKAKRGIVKSILARSRNTFNVASAEVDRQDAVEFAVLGFVTVTEGHAAGRQTLERLEEWLADGWPEVEIVAVELEER